MFLLFQRQYVLFQLPFLSFQLLYFRFRRYYFDETIVVFSISLLNLAVAESNNISQRRESEIREMLS